jgi:hypothetical protein
MEDPRAISPLLDEHWEKPLKRWLNYLYFSTWPVQCSQRSDSAARRRTKQQRFDFLYGQEIFLVFQASGPALSSTQTPSQRVPEGRGAIFTELKRPECEADL